MSPSLYRNLPDLSLVRPVFRLSLDSVGGFGVERGGLKTVGKFIEG